MHNLFSELRFSYIFIIVFHYKKVTNKKVYNGKYFNGARNILQK